MGQKWNKLQDGHFFYLLVILLTPLLCYMEIDIHSNPVVTVAESEPFLNHFIIVEF